jgi:hypothetical protein
VAGKERFLPALLPTYYFFLHKKGVFDTFQSDVEENMSTGFPELNAYVLVPKQGRKITSPAVYFCLRTKFTSRVLFDVTLTTTVVGVEGKITLRHQSTILSSTAHLTGM